MEKKHLRKRVILALFAVILIALILWTIWGNSALELNELTLVSSTLPEAFHGYRIAHVSDLHNAQMGSSNETLLAMLRSAQPDLIAITGNLID
ncbi:MAG: metallophosphoesterase, partial [Oscillospiraceae bacterium]|nr:metallophosphoesterase [Oscillospiraceae bacterium]